MKKTFIAISLALFSCLTLAACTANATSTQEIPSNSGEDIGFILLPLCGGRFDLRSNLPPY